MVFKKQWTNTKNSVQFTTAISDIKYIGYYIIKLDCIGYVKVSQY